MNNSTETPSSKDWETGLLDWVSACQSSYYIDKTPGHRFGGLSSQLEDQRLELVNFVREVIDEHVQAALTKARAQLGEPIAWLRDDGISCVTDKCKKDFWFEFGRYTTPLFCAQKPAEPMNAAERHGCHGGEGATLTAEPVTSSVPYEHALSELIDKIIPGLDSGDILADAQAASAALAQVKSVQQSNAQSPQPPHPLTFPTYLRKMWSGSEVQAWLDEQAARAAHPAHNNTPNSNC